MQTYDVAQEKKDKVTLFKFTWLTCTKTEQVKAYLGRVGENRLSSKDIKKQVSTKTAEIAEVKKSNQKSEMRLW